MNECFLLFEVLNSIHIQLDIIKEKIFEQMVSFLPMQDAI